MSSENDICANRHRGNPESQKANARTNKARDRQRIVSHLTIQGSSGATCYELSRDLNMPYTTASGRCAELKRDNMVIPKPATLYTKKPSRRYEMRPTGTGSPAAVLVLAKYGPRPKVRVDERQMALQM